MSFPHSPSRSSSHPSRSPYQWLLADRSFAQTAHAMRLLRRNEKGSVHGRVLVRRTPMGLPEGPEQPVVYLAKQSCHDVGQVWEVFSAQFVASASTNE
ncbi:hypothetical protein RRF57_000109 [Xylaria bambusicola]|uniref:Uncharacterized protein n=1 Tax=Xylaria bambusicola TaxID=326684 RepID=A0AAN7UA67_9PEZI